MSDQSRLPDQTVERVLATLPGRRGVGAGGPAPAGADPVRQLGDPPERRRGRDHDAARRTPRRADGLRVGQRGRGRRRPHPGRPDRRRRSGWPRSTPRGRGSPPRAAPARPRASTWPPRARPRRTAPRWSAGSSTEPRGSRPRGTAGPTTGPAVSRARRGSRSPARPWSAGSPGSPGSTAPTAWPVTHRSASPSSTVSPSVGERPPRHAARREPWSCRRVATRSCWSPTPSST